MADAIKSVVVEIETKLQGNAIDNLNKGLRTADSLSEELARQIQVVDKAIQSTNAKKLKINGTDTSKKELQELSNALKLAAKDFDQLSDIQKNTLAALLKENAKVVESLENTAQSSDGAKQGAEGYLRAVNVLTPLLGQHGVAISLVVSNYLEYAEAAKKGDASSTQLGGTLTLLRNKWAALGVAVAATIGIGINEYFARTEEGADKAAEVLEGLKETYRSFAGGVFLILSGFKKAITSPIFGAAEAEELLRKGLDALGDAFSGKAGERGTEFAKLIDSLEDKIDQTRIKSVSLQAAIAGLREVLSEEIIDLPGVNRALDALDKYGKAIKQIAENEKETAELQLQVAIQRAANVSQGDKLTEASVSRTVQLIREGDQLANLNDVQKEYRDEIIAALQELKRLETEESQRGRTLNRTEKSIKNQSKALQKEFTDITKGLLKQSQELEISDPFNLAKIITNENRIQAQDRLREGFEKIAEDFKTLSRILGVPDILTLSQQDISKLEQKYKLVGGTIFNAVARGVANQNAIKGLLDSVFETREIQSVAKLPGVQKAVTDISKQIQNAVNVTNNLPQQDKASVLERIFGLSDEEKKKIGDLLQQAQTDIVAAANTFYDTEIQKTDFLIQEQQRRIDETARLAELGNAEQLQLEQERLNKLLEERRKFEQAQAAINAAAAISATAVAASTFAASITKESLSTTPLVAIANSIALVAAIGAGIAQISALAQGFEKGTEYLRPGQKSNKGKTDTIPAWLAPGERVVPAMINEQLKGIKNADLPKLVAAGKMALEGYGQLNTSITSNSYGFSSEAVGLLKRQNELLAEIPKAVSDQIVDINFDHYGYVIQQRRVSRHAQKVKALTR